MRTSWTALLIAGLAPTTALAADHADGPAAAAVPHADIADFFAWHTTEGKLVAILTTSPLLVPGAAATYDSSVLYGIHIDRDTDGVADHDIWVRFGEASDGTWGMKIQGLPGASGDVVGAVDTPLVDGPTQAWAGVSDDPFFFDLTGFNDTLSTATLSFTGTDALAGMNVQAIVLEMDLGAAADSAARLDLWATTHTK